jgi:hypothetical protein
MFSLIFQLKTGFKVLQRVTGFSALVTRYLKDDLRPILASHKSKIILEMSGSPEPLQILKQKDGTPSPLAPLYRYLIVDGAKNTITPLTSFLKRKQVF